jgi:hypothetical protein
VIEVFDCPQYSPEWYAARLGIPTASEFHKLFMSGKKKGEESKTRRRYMLDLIGEKLTGQPRDTYSNHHMDRGKEMEAEACKLYAMLEDAELQTVGFMRNEKAGCSPDRLVGANGLLQIKTMLPPLLLDLHLTTKPADYDEHDYQLYGELWISEREWTELLVYWPGIKPYRKRVYRDEVKIKSIELGVEMFENEMHELMSQLEAA